MPSRIVDLLEALGRTLDQLGIRWFLFESNNLLQTMPGARLSAAGIIAVAAREVGRGGCRHVWVETSAAEGRGRAR